MLRRPARVEEEEERAGAGAAAGTAMCLLFDIYGRFIDAISEGK